MSTIKTYLIGIEAQIHQEPNDVTKSGYVKSIKTEAVNFQNYGEQNALGTVGTYHSKYRREANTLPIG